MATIQELKNIATQVRRDVIRMVHAQQSGHPGAALGCADLLTSLYFEIMNHNPKNFNMKGDNEDVFYLSNGHLSAVWYSVLARSGYFPTKELSTFRTLNSRLQGHPTPEEGLEGIRIASGSLGQGLSVACGTALAKKLNNDKSTVYALMGDGELQEGQIWEAAMFASARKIDNIIAFIDYNKKQIDGPIDKVVDLLDLNAKWKSFGWEVLEMNGNNIEDILKTINKAKELTGNQKPIVIIMNTIMGYGVDFMEDKHKWHGSAPNDEQKDKALEQLTETLGDF